MKRVLLALGCLAALRGQTQVDLRNQSKNVDFSAALATTPWKIGTTLPPLCNVGAAFFNTTAPAGANVYVCSALNQWTLATGGGGGGGGQSVTFATGSGAPTGACTVGQNLYVDVTNQDLWFCQNTNTWKKSLTTTNTGPFTLTGQNGTNPGAPGLGNTSLFFSSTAKVGQSVDDAGGIATMVRPTDCSAGSQLVQKVNGDGTVTCAAPAGGGGGGAGPVTRFFQPVGSTASNPRDLWYSDGIAASCDTGNTGVHCFYHWFEDGATHHAAVIDDTVPGGWSGGSVSVTLYYQGTGNTVQWSVASACQGNASTDPPAFNTAQNLAATATTAGKLYATTLTGLSTTGCGAGNAIYMRVQRVDSTGYVNLTGASAVYSIP